VCNYLRLQYAQISFAIEEDNNPVGTAKAARKNISDELFVKTLLKTN